MDPRPDLLLATGDIADNGDDRGLLRALPRGDRRTCPSRSIRRWAITTAATPSSTSSRTRRSADGFIQYAIEDLPVRILVLDTLEVGRHGGGFCETRAAWLDARGSPRRRSGRP